MGDEEIIEPDDTKFMTVTVLEPFVLTPSLAETSDADENG